MKKKKIRKIFKKILTIDDVYGRIEIDAFAHQIKMIIKLHDEGFLDEDISGILNLSKKKFKKYLRGEKYFDIRQVKKLESYCCLSF